MLDRKFHEHNDRGTGDIKNLTTKNFKLMTKMPRYGEWREDHLENGRVKYYPDTTETMFCQEF